jgi:hypothetical protein
VLEGSNGLPKDVVEPPKFITGKHVSAIFEKLGFDASCGQKVFGVLCEALTRAGEVGDALIEGDEDMADEDGPGERCFSILRPLRGCCDIFMRVFRAIMCRPTSHDVLYFLCGWFTVSYSGSDICINMCYFRPAVGVWYARGAVRQGPRGQRDARQRVRGRRRLGQPEDGRQDVYPVSAP